jgi:hypothetical protein
MTGARGYDLGEACGDDIADLIDRDIGKTAGTHQGRKLLAARLLTGMGFRSG